jgi:hypothetical protein
MKATQLFYNLGQSIWLDNITRDLLTSGTLQRYIDELSVTGLRHKGKERRKKLRILNSEFETNPNDQKAEIFKRAHFGFRPSDFGF